MTNFFKLFSNNHWFNPQGKASLPSGVVGIIVIICLLPFFLNLLGFSFASPPPPMDQTPFLGLTGYALQDRLHQTLAGSFIHTILEWSAVATAIFTVVLAFSYFHIKEDIITPIIGVTLLCAGMMDAFHTLAADRLIEGVESSQSLIPFTWALCRLANALLTIIGVSIFLIYRPKRLRNSIFFLTLTTVIFGSIAYGIIHICATSNSLPQTIFPEAFINRPWDVYPLVLFILSGLWIYPKFYHKYPSLFSHALIISTIPNAITQLHMVFGSTALFDNHFHIAHFLKIIAYLVPLTGLILDYTYTHRQVNEMNQNLSIEIEERKHIEKKLQESRKDEQEKARELESTLETLKRTQAQLIQSEKMSGLGQLVSGIAHEINNPANFIHGNLHYSSQYMADLLEIINLYQEEYPVPSAKIQNKIEDIDLDFLKSDIPQVLHSMKQGTLRIREIVKSLRTFARLDESDIKEIDVHEGIESTLMVVNSRLHTHSEFPKISVVKNYGDLPLVQCHPGEINQVFLNLLNNGIDAIYEGYLSARNHHQPRERGIITISTETLNDQEIQIRIKDNGIGIDTEVQSRLFTPFFTTKPVGKGTGLGLSICYQIITQRHRGKLSYISQPGEGTEFIIELPRLL